jgi:hypothetical protein
MQTMTNDPLTTDELAALSAAGWNMVGPNFTANGVKLLRFRLVSHNHTRTQSADEWRALIAGLQPPPVCAECARLRADLDTARRALFQAEQARDAERAARRNAEAALTLKEEVYQDLLRVVKEREAGR